MLTLFNQHETRILVEDAFTRSISTIWLVCTPIAVVSFFIGSCNVLSHMCVFRDGLSNTCDFIVLLMRKYTLKRHTVKGKNPSSSSSNPPTVERDIKDVEAGRAADPPTLETEKEANGLGGEDKEMTPVGKL